MTHSAPAEISRRRRAPDATDRSGWLPWLCLRPDRTRRPWRRRTPSYR